MYKETINDIIESDNKEMLKSLTKTLDTVMQYLYQNNYDLYKEIELDLYIATNGKKLNKDMAYEIIMNMKPYQMHWSLEETESIRDMYNLSDIRDVDFWVVMNSKYNDNKDTVERFVPNDTEKQLEMYVYLTRDFIKDKDAKEGKVFTYFTEIPE
jgi:hypothetical protein